MKRFLTGAVCLALMATSPYAAAHGPMNHDKKPPAAKAASVEERAFGREGDPAKVSRTVTVRMSDRMRYDPAEIRVNAGDTVRIVGANDGKVMHEIVIGTRQELDKHAELMRRHPNMEHDEPYMAHVSPGAKQEIVWQFTKPGEFFYGCLIPGHFEAGMVGKVIVAAR